MQLKDLGRGLGPWEEQKEPFPMWRLALGHEAWKSDGNLTVWSLADLFVIKTFGLISTESNP